MEARYILALVRQSLSALFSDLRLFAIMSGTMLMNDLLFFALWIIFFARVQTLKGWNLHDMGLFQGCVMTGFGVAVLLAKGCWRIGRRVVTGDLDIYLVRPRHPLPQLAAVECDMAAVGDIIFGVALLVICGWTDPVGMLLAFLSGLLVAGLFVAIAITVQSSAFFVRGGASTGDQLFEMTMCLGTIPQHTSGTVMKLVIFTVVPAGYMAILPVRIVQEHSVGLLLLLLAATAGYLAVAVAIFNRGLRRYTSATGWSA